MTHNIQNKKHATGHFAVCGVFVGACTCQASQAKVFRSKTLRNKDRYAPRLKRDFLREWWGTHARSALFCANGRVPDAQSAVFYVNSAQIHTKSA